jgi:uncharacterized repeat protein (TIGR04138 family)
VADPIQELARKDGRFAPEAFRFLFDSLEVAIRIAGKAEESGTERHVTGREVLDGLRRQALDTFGPLAPEVWSAWGVHETLDWGRIVFLLVDAGLLNRQESDTIDDFRDGFDFHAAFVKDYRPRLDALKEDAGPA